MKAIRIHSYGHSDQLNEEEVARPQIKADEVLVKIHDASINPYDWKIREGEFKNMMPTLFPFIMGQDFSGEVIEVGSRVNKLNVGDRVFGFAKGAYAEFAAIPEEDAVLIPRSLSYPIAASLPTAGLTAYQILKDFIKPNPGDKILIHGAGGAVGSFLAQIASHMGAEVIANASSKDKEYLQSIGIKTVFDYKTERFDELVKGLHAVVDLVGGDTAERSYPILKKGGILISTVGAVDEKKGKEFGIRTQAFLMKHDNKALTELVKLVAQGVVKPRIDRVLPFGSARLAQDLVQNGQSRGKIVLEILQ